MNDIKAQRLAAIRKIQAERAATIKPTDEFNRRTNERIALGRANQARLSG